MTAVLFTASVTASATDYDVLNARQILLMPSAVGPLQAWAKNMEAAMVLRSKPDGWKESWFVHRGQATTMLENQDLEPRILEIMVPRGGVRRPIQGPSKT